MAEKKKTLTDKEKIEKARKKRIAIAEERTLQPCASNANAREDFRKYFLKIKKQLNLDKSLEEVIWLHLKAIKHDKKELFEIGIKHFGYKI